MTCHCGRNHTATACYSGGCRELACRKAKSLAQKKYMVRVQRHGPSTTVAEPVVKVLCYLRDAGVTWREMGRATGIHWEQIERLGNGRRKETILQSTRDKLLPPLALLVQARQEQLADALSAIEYAQTKRVEAGGRRWPTEPLRAVMNGQAGQLGDADRRALYRPTVGDVAAERLADLAGVLPENIWDDWFAC